MEATSAIYANVLCAYYENEAIKSIGYDHRLVAGIRQVDDLLLFIAYEHDNKKSENKAISLKEYFLGPNRVYKGGLHLEIQQPILQSKFKCTLKFAGTKVLIEWDCGLKFSCQPFLKNYVGLLKNGSLDYPRFIHKTSAAPVIYKRSCIQGTLHRFLNQTTDGKFLTFSLYANFLELYSLGFSLQDFISELNLVTAKKPDLFDAAHNFKNYWSKSTCISFSSS